MGQVLYRKYRSKKLSEIVGQEHITTTLANALKNGNISHAYLFTGPRGVGKTSIARILAHEVNGLPYTEDSTHLDIIEIDAASNRRIDEIRELRDKVHNAPTSVKYKVYIIDEVHMLTREAFNALLKTLEEPPDHAIFILATTEAHKVPETIISRTQRFAFKPIPAEKVISHLREIAGKESITISDEALGLIAAHGDGSFRDSISLLDQVSGANKVTLGDVQSVLGIAPSEAIDQLVELVRTGSSAELANQLSLLNQQGYQAPQIARQISQRLRQEVLSDQSAWDKLEATNILQKLLGVPAAHNPSALLELILLEVSFDKNEAPKTVPTAAEKPAKQSPDKPVVEQPLETSIPKPPTKPTATSASLDATSWQQVLQAIKHKHNTLYGIVRMASPDFKNNELILRFAFPFHQKRMAEEKNTKLLKDTIAKQIGTDIAISFTIDKTVTPPAEDKAVVNQPPTNSLDTISNIFGPSEVLE